MARNKQISPTSKTIKPPKNDSNYKASKPTETKEIAHTADICISQRLMALGQKLLTMCRPNASRDFENIRKDIRYFFACICLPQYYLDLWYCWITDRCCLSRRLEGFRAENDKSHGSVITSLKQRAKASPTITRPCI